MSRFSESSTTEPNHASEIKPKRRQSIELINCNPICPLASPTKVKVFWDVSECPINTGVDDPADILRKFVWCLTGFGDIEEMVAYYPFEMDPGLRLTSTLQSLGFTVVDTNTPDQTRHIMMIDMCWFAADYPQGILALMTGDSDFEHVLNTLQERNFMTVLITPTKLNPRWTNVATFHWDWLSFWEGAICCQFCGRYLASSSDALLPGLSSCNLEHGDQYRKILERNVCIVPFKDLVLGEVCLGEQGKRNYDGFIQNYLGEVAWCQCGRPFGWLFTANDEDIQPSQFWGLLTGLQHTNFSPKQEGDGTLTLDDVRCSQSTLTNAPVTAINSTGVMRVPARVDSKARSLSMDTTGSTDMPSVIPSPTPKTIAAATESHVGTAQTPITNITPACTYSSSHINVKGGTTKTATTTTTITTTTTTITATPATVTPTVVLTSPPSDISHVKTLIPPSTIELPPHNATNASIINRLNKKKNDPCGKKRHVLHQRSQSWRLDLKMDRELLEYTYDEYMPRKNSYQDEITPNMDRGSRISEDSDDEHFRSQSVNIKPPRKYSNIFAQFSPLSYRDTRQRSNSLGGFVFRSPAVKSRSKSLGGFNCTESIVRSRSNSIEIPRNSAGHENWSGSNSLESTLPMRYSRNSVRNNFNRMGNISPAISEEDARESYKSGDRSTGTITNRNNPSRKSRDSESSNGSN